MQIFWFCAVAVMITVYVILDGFDLGAGIVHFAVARNERERQTVVGSVGPVWDGNEVWLLAAGGTLYFSFPSLYASSFSGFYLPLMMVLWLLILRAISIEFRNHLDTPTWKPFWDFWFTVASALLAVFFGAALGNVIRGVPLDAQGDFFLPLWTNFLVSPEPGILDWYTVSTGVIALLTLTMHGALWLNLKTDGDVQKRSIGIAAKTWIGVVVMTAVVTIATFQIQPHISESFATYPAFWLFPVLALAGLAGVRWMLALRQERNAFLASCLYITGMLTSAVFGVFPYVLPSVGDSKNALTVYNASAPVEGLFIGLWWFIPGILIATAYFVHTYRTFGGKVRIDQEGY